jgi:hypothetical protein
MSECIYCNRNDGFFCFEIRTPRAYLRQNTHGEEVRDSVLGQVIAIAGAWKAFVALEKYS